LRSFKHQLKIQRMQDWSQCPAVERHAHVLSGAWVFQCTRVPVAALFENLKDGAQVKDFVRWFPGVSQEQVRLVLAQSVSSLQVS
jgi:uncharacterized protein (DUF433 family)